MKRHNIALALTALLASSAASADIIISEYIEGSSNNKAIELFNTTDATVDLSQYALQRFSNGGTSPANIALSGTLAAKSTYVLVHSSANATLKGYADIETTDINHNGDDGWALVKGDVIVDSFGKLGEDPGTAWESGDVSTVNMTLRRKDAVMTGDSNFEDAFDPAVEWDAFAQDTFDGLGSHAGYAGSDPEPEPEPEPEPTEFGVCGDSAHRISAIQGNALSEATGASPLVGQIVIVEAVVTGVYKSGERPLNGFFLQEEDAHQDDDPNSSEGIFVYSPTDTYAPVAGQLVRIQGEVAEYFNGTQLSNISNMVVCAEGQDVTPAALELPLTSRDEFERFEGMLVQVQHPVVVTGTDQLGQYGEFKVADERLMTPTEIAAPGEPAKAVAAAKAARVFRIDDARSVTNATDVPFPPGGLSADNTLRLGTEITNPQGIMHYSFDEYRLLPTQDLQFVDVNPRTTAPAAAEMGDVRVAVFNLLNLFNGDGQGGGFPTERGANNILEYDRQLPKAVAAILGLQADVVGLIELENDGNGENSMLVQLVAALNDAGDSEWAFVNVGGSGIIGGDAITNAIIYRTDRVAETGTGVFTTQVPFDYGSRPPVAQTFKDLVNEDEFTFVVAHLRSKGSCSSSAADGDKDTGDGQGCWNATRVAAVEKLQEWLAGHPTGRTDEDVIVMGDMNAYTMEDPITAMVEGGFTNLKAAFAEEGQATYTYWYRDESGSLEHAFGSEAMTAKVVAAQAWHINVDEPKVFDYNLEYKDIPLDTQYYNEDPYRSSDHDPVIVAFTTVESNPDDDGGTDPDIEDPGAETPEEEHVNIDHATTSSSFPLWFGLVALLMAGFRRRA
ncbi:ExeM/NucH family extracellular endonuclease [Pseudidiomarina sp. WS423]|uniref:ExeM/NucH family extracellular endonuclease n=1 Tax=Pseudidiomarina sp. WS423 TaxID=3425124 RepID=UPI003D6FBBAA